ncbi:MBL fold metallo-hydrolase [Candidatus Nanohalococcus occultus]|uniref:MBL fold metallo-hydrolase n=1 Tax=Candidatus Nanohalococcus occultus TaxID=2978047 RepID=UPI0039E08C32
MNYNGLEFSWKGHSTVKVEDEGFSLVVDPFNGYVDREAELVLVTHDHEGHFDPEALEKVCGDSTCLVVPESFEGKELPCRDVEYVTEGEVIDVFGVEIEAVPMYNEHHEQGDGFGYRFVMNKTSVYVAGDTGLIKEASQLEGVIDVAFLPVEGVYTMDVEDAIQMAVRIKPSVVVPYHYGEPFFPDAEVDLRGLRAELEDRNIRCQVLDS